MMPQISIHRSLRIATSASLAALGLLLSGTSVLAEAVVKQVSGRVELGRGEPVAWQPLTMKQSIRPDDRIRTGADGRVEIAMDAGTMRVHENSLLRLPPASKEADRVDLERGNSLFDVLRRNGRRFEVHTPTVVVSVKGTRFGVQAIDGEGEVSVFRGLVGVRELGADAALETLVREGFTALGGSGSPIELDLTPEGDPWAQWQVFGSALDEHRVDAVGRMTDVDRANALLRKTTNEAVIRKAAERRPEVAERLRTLTGEKTAVRQTGGDHKDQKPGAGARDRGFPASPKPGAGSIDRYDRIPGDRSKDDHSDDLSRRDLGDRSRQLRKDVIDETFDDSRADTSLELARDAEGGTNLSFLLGSESGSDDQSSRVQISIEDLREIEPTTRGQIISALARAGQRNQGAAEFGSPGEPDDSSDEAFNVLVGLGVEDAIASEILGMDADDDDNDDD